jgi:hypothetical protein
MGIVRGGITSVWRVPKDGRDSRSHASPSGRCGRAGATDAPDVHERHFASDCQCVAGDGQHL